MVTVKSSQKIFTEEEISGLTGICLDHLRSLARSKHLGSIARAAEAAGEQAEQWLFTNSDLMVLAVLVPRCHH
jgi:phage gp46-like protein